MSYPDNSTIDEKFIAAFRLISSSVFRNNCAKGFWDAGIENRNKGELIALMHSELSEALEAIRHNNPPDNHLTERDSLSVELADTIIRIMDFASAFDLPVAECVIEKIAYNKSRPHKHGKNF